MASERGQASAEWVALLGIVSLLLGAMLAAGTSVPGIALAESIARKIACAANLGSGCGGPGELTIAYGEELGALVEEHAPLVAYERGMRGRPVDFRDCADVGCAESGAEPPAAFTHVVDCRGANGHCDDDADGFLFLQYWFYYPDSYTAPWGDAARHRHDWESYQVRIGADGDANARASAHHGYDHDGRGLQSWANQIGRLPVVGVELPKDGGWGPELGTLWVSDGSHAGRVVTDDFDRQTPRRRLQLIPLEKLAGAEGAAYDFGSVTPPWRKGVWTDPTSEDT